MTDDQYKETLSPERYHVLREKGTERAFTGEYDEFFEEGMYNCGACGAQLFASDNKYHSGCGWPAFDQALDGAVIFSQDDSHGMHRTEVTCANCGSHLGHIFDDGPQETTGKRYCINSLALDFAAKQDE